MSLFKKIGFTIFVTLALSLGVWGYFDLKENKKPGVEALSVLPDSCLVYLHTSDFFELNKKLNSQSLIADKLKAFTGISELCNTLRLLDSLFKSTPLLAEEIGNTPIHFALYTGHSGPFWLVALNIHKLGDQHQMQEAMMQLFHAKLLQNDIREFRLASRRFYFNLASGVVLVSNEAEEIRHVLNGTGAKLIHNHSFLEFKNSLEEKGLLSIYVDHGIYLKSGMQNRLNLSSLCGNGYSAGSIDLQPSQVKVNGYLNTGSNELIAALLEQSAQPTDFVHFLPAGTCAFKAYGFSSFMGLKTRLDKKGLLPTFAFWKTINDSALYNMQEEFYLNIVSSVVDFKTDPEQPACAAVQITDTALAMEHLKAMSDSILHESADSMYRLRGALGEKLELFDPLLNTHTYYAARKGNYLYFSSEPECLFQLLRNLRNGTLLANDESFMNYRNQHFYDSFNYLVYLVPARCKEEINDFFKMDRKEEKEVFTNFRHFSFSLARQGERFKFRWQLQNENKKTDQEQPVFWTLQLDTLCLRKAQGFVNHLTKENEVLVQDQAKTLYLINAKGTVLWKKKLTESIHSEIFTVDAFRNNKYQILFSTANYLHLLDRNGNYVSGYPLKLPAEASSGLSLFDYDANRDYRLFIACKNRWIYNYSLGGVKQPGFAPLRTDHEVNLPIQYIKVGLSDYLAAVDQEGKIYTFSRRGERRIGLRNRTTADCLGIYLDATNNINSTYLVYPDTKNNSINRISFTDKKELIQLNHFIEHATLSFGQAEEAGNTDIILTTPEALMIYDLNGNLLLKHSFGKELLESALYKDENSILLLTRSKDGDLMIYDRQSRKIRSFKATALPWTGHLFNDHKKYAVITNGKLVNCVLLN